MGQAIWNDGVLLCLRHYALGCGDLERTSFTTFESGEGSYRGWNQDHQLGPVVGYIA